VSHATTNAAVDATPTIDDQPVPDRLVNHGWLTTTTTDRRRRLTASRRLTAMVDNDDDDDDRSSTTSRRLTDGQP
jgi:hypothetical protein